MAQVREWYGVIYGTAMGGTWNWYGTWLPIEDPLVISFVFFYGIATYLAEFHMFPIFYGMGLIRVSPIPIPYHL